MQNDALLAEAGTIVAPPGKMRPAIRRAMQARGDLVSESASGLLEEMLGDRAAEAQRVVLSHEGFLGVYAKVLAGPLFYADADKRASKLRDLFPGHQVRFHLGLRNPATFVPALFEASSIEDFDAFIAGHDIEAMRWSAVIDRIRGACPDVPLTIWCNEDLPLIWPDLLRDMAGVDAEMKGEDAILRQIMTRAGFQRLTDYLRDNPAPDLKTWRKVVTAFLGKYADPAKIDEEIALPGWSEERIAALTVLYERDIEAIAGRDDLTFIRP